MARKKPCSLITVREGVILYVDYEDMKLMSELVVGAVVDEIRAGGASTDNRLAALQSARAVANAILARLP